MFQVLTLIALILTSLIISLAEAKPLDHVHVELSFSPEYNSAGGSNIVDSGVFAEISSQHPDLAEYLQTFSKTIGADQGSSFGVRLRLSGAPSSLRTSAEQDAVEQVNRAFAQVLNDIADQIDLSINTDPRTSHLPSQMKEALSDHLYSSAQQELAMAQKAKLNQIADRFDDAQLDLSIQEINLYATVRQDQTMWIFSVGKGFYGGPGNYGPLTALDLLRPQLTWSQRIATSAATSGAKVSFLRLFGEYQVQVDLVALHGRIPFMGANQYITDLLLMPENMYENERELSDINSALFNLMFKSPKGELYATGDSYDGNSAFQGGLNLNLTPKDMISISWGTSNRHDSPYQDASTVVYSHRLTPRITPYVVAEGKSYRPYTIPREAMDQNLAGVGAQISVCSRDGQARRVRGLWITCFLKTEVDHILPGSDPDFPNHQKADHTYINVGFYLNGQFN